MAGREFEVDFNEAEFLNRCNSVGFQLEHEELKELLSMPNAACLLNQITPLLSSVLLEEEFNDYSNLLCSPLNGNQQLELIINDALSHQDETDNSHKPKTPNKRLSQLQSEIDLYHSVNRRLVKELEFLYESCNNSSIDSLLLASGAELSKLKNNSCLLNELTEPFFHPISFESYGILNSAIKTTNQSYIQAIQNQSNQVQRQLTDHLQWFDGVIRAFQDELSVVKACKVGLNIQQDSNLNRAMAKFCLLLDCWTNQINTRNSFLVALGYAYKIHYDQFHYELNAVDRLSKDLNSAVLEINKFSSLFHPECREDGNVLRNDEFLQLHSTEFQSSIAKLSQNIQTFKEAFDRLPKQTCIGELEGKLRDELLPIKNASIKLNQRLMQLEGHKNEL